MGASNKTFAKDTGSFSVVSGTFRKRVPEGTIGAVPRKLTKGKNEGQTVFESCFLTIDGILSGGRLVQSDQIGCTAEIDLTDACGTDTVSFSAGVKEMSQYLKSFVRCLPNINPAEPIYLNLTERQGKKTKFGNPVYYMNVYQNNRKVKDAYVEFKTGADGKKFAVHLHDYPEAEQMRDGSYDYRDQNEFLLMKFEEYFADFQSPVAVMAEEHQEPVFPGGVSDDGPKDDSLDIDSDDIPF